MLRQSITIMTKTLQHMEKVSGDISSGQRRPGDATEPQAPHPVPQQAGRQVKDVERSERRTRRTASSRAGAEDGSSRRGERREGFANASAGTIGVPDSHHAFARRSHRRVDDGEGADSGPFASAPARWKSLHGNPAVSSSRSRVAHTRHGGGASTRGRRRRHAPGMSSRPPRRRGRARSPPARIWPPRTVSSPPACAWSPRCSPSTPTTRAPAPRRWPPSTPRRAAGRTPDQPWRPRGTRG